MAQVFEEHHQTISRRLRLGSTKTRGRTNGAMRTNAGKRRGDMSVATRRDGTRVRDGTRNGGARKRTEDRDRPARNGNRAGRGGGRVRSNSMQVNDATTDKPASRGGKRDRSNATAERVNRKEGKDRSNKTRGEKRNNTSGEHPGNSRIKTRKGESIAAAIVREGITLVPVGGSNQPKKSGSEKQWLYGLLGGD